MAEEKKISDEDFVNLEIENYLSSKIYKMCLDARNYYKNKNDIWNKKRYYIENGEKKVAKGLENNIIAHPIFRELVDQKVNYLLSNDWDVDNEELAEIFNDEFRVNLNRASADAIKYRIGWLFALPGAIFKYIDGFKVLPTWTDESHNELEKLIRMYSIEVNENNEKKEIKYAELWTKEGVTTYKQNNDGKYVFESNVSHLMEVDENNQIKKGSERNWEKIPFIYIKYNQDELPLIALIKSLIDKMDKTASDTQDLLSDLTNKMIVVSGAPGTDPKEVAINRKSYRIVVLPDQATYAEVGSDPDITAAKTWIEHLRSQVYIAGRGYDPLQAIGANASGEARRNLYTNLDLDVNQLEIGVLEGLKRCIWFINYYPGSTYSIPEDTKIKFARNMLVNQSEQIDNALKAQGIKGIAMETILGMTGLVENIPDEIKKAKEEELAEMQEQADIFNLNNNKSFNNNKNNNNSKK